MLDCSGTGNRIDTSRGKRLATYIISNDQLNRWYLEWLDGRSKNDIERVELGDNSSHGKKITKLWRDRLHIETEKEHPLI